jgi:hypothetical protein
MLCKQGGYNNNPNNNNINNDDNDNDDDDVALPAFNSDTMRCRDGNLSNGMW